MDETNSLLAALTALAAQRDGGGGSAISSPGTSAASSPRPQLVSVPPMGAVYGLVQHPMFAAYERQFRKEPDANFYTPQQGGFKFEVGGLRAPKQHALLLTGYKIEAARLSGVTPGDTQLVEPGRLSTVWGFDLRVAGIRDRNCQYELEPVPIQAGQQATETIPATGRVGKDSKYVRDRAAQYAVPGGAGRSLLPFRAARYGSPQGPFTIILREGAALDMACIIFKPIPIPLAYVEFTVSGYEIPNTLLDAFIAQIAP